MNPIFNVVLVNPEIPQNTGTIGRSCVGFKSRLHLIKPYGFEISDKQVRRAGLDYWGDLDLVEYDSLEELMGRVPDPTRLFYFSSKVSKPYWSNDFQAGDWLVFGPETRGLDPHLLAGHPERGLTIPFVGPIRSFNLSNAVSMALGEAFRQVHGQADLLELS